MKSICKRNLGWLLCCGIVLSHGGVAACREQARGIRQTSKDCKSTFKKGDEAHALRSLTHQNMLVMLVCDIHESSC